MKSIQKGFTLIELMIVVAIIGILAATAVSAYQDYVAKAQVSETLELFSGLKAPLAEWVQAKGTWPVGFASIGVQTSGNYVGEITLTGATGTSGTVTAIATMKTANVSSIVRGTTVLFKSDDGVHWACSAGTIASSYLPQACK